MFVLCLISIEIVAKASSVPWKTVAESKTGNVGAERTRHGMVH